MRFGSPKRRDKAKKTTTTETSPCSAEPGEASVARSLSGQSASSSSESRQGRILPHVSQAATLLSNSQPGQKVSGSDQKIFRKNRGLSLIYYGTTSPGRRSR